jgi:hypothetical protein
MDPAAEKETMFDDPKALTSSNWNDIHNWLTFLWIYFPLIITFAFTMLVAHGFIPSLVSTKHLPQSANKIKAPLTVFALSVLGVAMVFMVLAINATLDVEKVWDRYLI